MNRDWVVRLALRVAIRSQRDRCHQFLRFMESPLSIFRMHWDHEPEMRKSLEISESIFRFMESLDAKISAYWDHEPRIGAWKGAEVGRLESRPSEQWFMESLQSQKLRAHWDHEPRIGAWKGAEVGRLESRPSEQWFMESLQSQKLRAHWDHEPHLTTFCCICNKRLSHSDRFMGSQMPKKKGARWDHEPGRDGFHSVPRIPGIARPPKSPKAKTRPTRSSLRIASKPSSITREIMGRGGTRPYPLEDGALKVIRTQSQFRSRRPRRSITGTSTEKRPDALISVHG